MPNLQAMPRGTASLCCVGAERQRRGLGGSPAGLGKQGPHIQRGECSPSEVAAGSYTAKRGGELEQREGADMSKTPGPEGGKEEPGHEAEAGVTSGRATCPPAPSDAVGGSAHAPHSPSRRAGLLPAPPRSLSLLGTPLTRCRCPIGIEARLDPSAPRAFMQKTPANLYLWPD